MEIKYQQFFSDDDFWLLRKHIKEIYDKSVNYIVTSAKPLRILEIGPSETVWFEGLDTNWVKNNAKQLGHRYSSFDVCGDVDVVGTIENCPQLKDSEFDVVICLSVLEHVRDIFSASKELSRIIKPGGKLYMETPFLWRIHGPVPDYWRISEYAYEFLFGKDFEYTLDTCPENQFGKNSYPLSYNAVMTKR